MSSTNNPKANSFTIHPSYASNYGFNINAVVSRLPPISPHLHRVLQDFRKDFLLYHETIINGIFVGLHWLQQPIIALPIMQGWFILFASLIIPLFIRWTLLSSPLNQEINLPIVYPVCDLDYRECPFPIARISAEDLFVESVHYQLSIKLIYSDDELNSRIGIFSNEIKIFDANNKSLGRWRRAGLSSNTRPLSKALQAIDLINLLENQNTIELRIIKDFFVTPGRPPKQLVYILQDHMMQFDEINLIINAKMGYLANFFHFWPLLSFFIMSSVILIVGCFTMIGYWLCKAYQYYVHPAVQNLCIHRYHEDSFDESSQEE